MNDKTSQTAPATYQTTGSIERLDQEINKIIKTDAKLEIIAQWVSKENAENTKERN